MLDRCLTGQILTEVHLRGIFRDGELKGHRVTSVEAVGKHFVITVEDRVLRIHLGMHGLWERHPVARQGPVVLGTGRDWLVCRQPKDIEVFLARDRRRHPVLSRLGPDLLAEEPDLEEVVRRAQEFPGPAGELLLCQQVAAGLGNVYKSEVCFMERVSPWRAARPEELEPLFRRGRDLLRANLGGWERTTTVDARVVKLAPGSERLWVYERAGRPCLRCGAAIQVRAQGLEARSTWWCPTCQR